MIELFQHAQAKCVPTCKKSVGSRRNQYDLNTKRGHSKPVCNAWS